MGYSGDQDRATTAFRYKQAVRSKNYIYHILVNRKHFYLNHAIILIIEKEIKKLYRLVVSHNNQLLTDRFYPSLRGAKIAFKKLHGEKGYKENLQAIWSEIKEGGDLSLLDPPLPPLL